ncbi:phage holin, LLH family [Dethiothermospora halolimnae]|uniref:phage holin, LLH family n=1 Tax=Dethiothermospora halolimnae TaxID=3114390 RepID=UPI003CCBF80A
MDSKLFMEIALGVFTIVGAIFTYALVPYLKEKRVYKWVVKAVYAAEQIFRGTNLGEKKKRYVLNFLKDNGINISESQLNILIEAAVRQLNTSKVEG